MTHYLIIIFYTLVVYRSGNFVSCRQQTESRNRNFLARIRSVVEMEKEFYLKVDELVTYSQIPGHLRSSARDVDHQNKALWLLEDFPLIVNKQDVIDKVCVWMCDSPMIVKYDFIVKEILYRLSGNWKIRNISQRHKLPIEYISSIQHIPPNVPIRKFFLDIYVDDFGTYRNVYHSLGGVYLQFGNMPLMLRKQLRNHFLLGFVPFGGDIYEFFGPLREEIRALEHGYMVNTSTGNYWVMGGIGCVTADLPQGNDLAGVKRHNANFGCRTCYAHQNQLTDSHFDYLANARFRHLTENQYAEITALPTISARERCSTKYGICVDPHPLENLMWDCHTQTPHDAYHAMGGKTRRLLDTTFNLLTSSGE